MTRNKKKNQPETIEELLDDVSYFNTAINREKDYPCVLILGGFLDKALGALLSAYLADKEVTDWFLDFRRNGPLSSFRCRIDMVYNLGLISTGAYKNLNVVRDIRNRFAHSHRILDFTDTEVIGLCEKLYQPDWIGDKRIKMVAASTDTPRRKFAQVVLFLFGYLITCHNKIARVKKKVDEWDKPQNESPK